MTAAILTNIVFWSGVAIGGVAFAALLEVTGAAWAGPMRRIAEGFRWFLPISFAAVVAFMWRSSDAYPWGRHPMGDRWWTPWFVAVRADAALAVVYLAAFAFCRSSRRASARNESGAATPSAIVFLLVYAVGFSSFAADAIMSLEPRWISTLFPAYVFTGNVYAGITAAALLAMWSDGAAAMTPARSRDTANLIVAAGLFWFYLFWSQFLVIWYGNLTSEVGYVMRHLESVQSAAWAVFVLACALPALVLIPRRGKQSAAIMALTPLILAGLWLERWLLIAPDVPSPSLSAGVMIALLFGAVFVAVVRAGAWGRSASRRPHMPAPPQ